MSQNKSVNEMNEEFINKLIEEAGMGVGLEADVLSQLKSDMLERLEDRIKAVILANIPEYKLGEFEKLIDSGNAKEIQDFCILNIPNFTEVIAGEFLNFRSRYINIA